MTHITVALPDQVAQQYYKAAELLADYIGETDQPPTAPNLMRFILSGFTAEEVARQFDLTLRNLTGVPVPGEPEHWVFDPQFENAP